MSAWTVRQRLSMISHCLTESEITKPGLNFAAKLIDTVETVDDVQQYLDKGIITRLFQILKFNFKEKHTIEDKVLPEIFQVATDAQLLTILKSVTVSISKPLNDKVTRVLLHVSLGRNLESEKTFLKGVLSMLIKAMQATLSQHNLNLAKPERNDTLEIFMDSGIFAMFASIFWSGCRSTLYKQPDFTELFVDLITATVNTLSQCVTTYTRERSTTEVVGILAALLWRKELVTKLNVLTCLDQALKRLLPIAESIVEPDDGHNKKFILLLGKFVKGFRIYNEIGHNIVARANIPPTVKRCIKFNTV